MSCNLIKSKEVQEILNKIDEYCSMNNIKKDLKVKPLSEYELSNLPELPNLWGWVISNDISTFITNGVHSPTSTMDELGINKKMLRITDLKDNEEPNFENLPYCKRFKDKDCEKTIKKNDIYISFTGNKLGKRYIVKKDKEDVVFAHYFVRWQPLIVNPKYIYYVLLSHHFDRFMYEHTLGSTQPNLKVTDLKRVPLPLAPLLEQDKIAKVLSNLDEKIKVNNQINKKLEAMAQSIFKHWFVDFEFPNENGEPYKSSGGEMEESELGMIPKGWQASRLSEVADITMGQSPKGSSYNEDGIGEVFYQGRTDFSDRFPVRRLFTTEPKKMAKLGDVLLSVRAPVGDINIAYEDCCIGRGLCSIRSKDEHSSYIFHLMMNLKEKLNIYNNEGTVFGAINKGTLSNISIVKPDNYRIEMFNKLASSLDKQYLCFGKQNRNLLLLRDALLPKLMSGEIRVPVDTNQD
ncbi:restriction endonuclease subunit S [Tepidibacter sp. Z1-5]|uniref:restriction endonuclease subunit S n=1 Tax=Tepidibacter sp. Z1-5 TaxID=3134138 RepID=UPI0030BC2561